MRLAILPALALVLGVGCARTEVLVVFSSNIAADLVGDLHVQLSGTSAAPTTYFDDHYPTADNPLPQSINIVQEAYPATGFTVVGTLTGQATSVTRRAVVPFYQGRSLQVRFALDADCIGITCDPSLTCVRGSCTTPDLEPVELDADLAMTPSPAAAPQVVTEAGRRSELVAPVPDDLSGRGSSVSATLSWSHTVGTGDNRVLVVSYAAISAAAPTAANFGGRQMSVLIPDTIVPGGIAGLHAGSFYVVGPNNNPADDMVTIRFAAPAHSVGASLSFSGAAQVMPTLVTNQPGSAVGVTFAPAVPEPFSVYVAWLATQVADSAPAFPANTAVNAVSFTVQSGPSLEDVEGGAAYNVGAGALSFNLITMREFIAQQVVVRPVGADATWMHETRAGSGRSLLVSISSAQLVTPPVRVSYGAQDLTRLPLPDDFGQQSHLFFYHLPDPLEGTFPIAVVGAPGVNWLARSLGLANVSSTPPIAAFGRNTGLATSTPAAQGGPQTLSVNAIGVSARAAPATLAPGHVERWNVATGTTEFDALSAGAVEAGPAADGAGWTLSAPTSWTQGTVVFGP